MSKSVKKIVKNSFFQTFGSFGASGLQFALTVRYATLLGPAHYGSLNTSLAQVTIWSLLVDLGLSNGLIGALTAAQGEKSELARQGFRSRDLLARVLFIRLAGAFIGSAVVFFFAWLHASSQGQFSTEQFHQDIAYTPFLFALAMQQTAIAYSSFRGRQGLAVFSMLSGIFCSVSSAIFLAWKGYAITWLLLAQSWGGFLTTAILFSVFALQKAALPEAAESTRRLEKKRRGPWGGEAWRALGQDAWPYAITFAAAVLWQRLDQIVASRFLGMESAGQYALAVRLVAIPVLIATSISFAAFPDLQRIGRDAPEKIIPYLGAVSKFLYRYGIFLAALMLFGVAALVGPLVPKFGPALHLLPWFIPGIWAFWIHSFIVNALFAFRRYWAVVNAHLVALAAYLVMLPILAKLFGLPGVAWGCNVFPLVLLFVCLLRLRETELVGERFSLFAKFTETEIELLQKVGEKFIPRGLLRR